MVSEESELFRAHPDWAIGVPGRPRTPSRQQLVLDLSRTEVVDHLFGAISAILASAPISYVKWDMNRSITEPYGGSLPPDRQGEFFHRYILGVYELYDRLNRAFPEVLFETLRERRRTLRPGVARLRPADLDERRHRRHRAAGDPVGDLAGLSAELDGRPRLGGPEPPGRPARPARHPGRRRRLRGLRLRARRDRPDAGRADGGGRPGRVLPRPPGPAPARPVPAAPRARSTATATRPPGCPSRRTPGRRSSACTACSTGRTRARHGCACAASTPIGPIGSRSARPTAIRSTAPIAGSAAATSSCELGLVLEAERHEAADWGDFRAWLFVLEAV